MGILDKVSSSYDALPLAEKEARNVALACALEPLSNKPGCVTRWRDENRNTLEMFVAGGINVFPAFYHLAEYLERTNWPEGIYQFFKEAILLSKYSRQGGQINQGILEFLCPIVATHILHDAESYKLEVKDLLKKSTETIIQTRKEDVSFLIEGKVFGEEITRQARGKGYTVHSPDAESVFEYYLMEYKREQESGEHVTGVLHNKQFVEGFQDILVTYEALRDSRRNFSGKVEDAYREVMNKRENLGMGVGLAADFTAVAIYIALSYLNEQDFIG